MNQLRKTQSSMPYTAQSSLYILICQALKVTVVIDLE